MTADAAQVEDDEYGTASTITTQEVSVQNLQRNWDYWMDLPNTSREFIRIDSMDDKIGALETMLDRLAMYKEKSEALKASPKPSFCHRLFSKTNASNYEYHRIQ